MKALFGCFDGIPKDLCTVTYYGQHYILEMTPMRPEHLKSVMLLCGLLLSGCWYKDLALHEPYLKGRLRQGNVPLNGYFYRVEPPRIIEDSVWSISSGSYQITRRIPWPGFISAFHFYGDGTLLHSGMSFTSSMDSFDLKLRAFYSSEKGQYWITESLSGHGFFDVMKDSTLIDYYAGILNGMPQPSTVLVTFSGDSTMTHHHQRVIRLWSGAFAYRDTLQNEELVYRFRPSSWKPDSIGALQLSRSFTRKGRKYL